MNDFELEIMEELIGLAEDGLVLISCPKCIIPLNSEEFSSLNCNKCGSINFDEIIVRVKDNSSLN